MNDDSAAACDGNTVTRSRSVIFRRRAEWKRHEFSDFLTRTGVTAALAKAALALYRTEDRPADPIEYVHNRMTGEAD